MNFGPPGREFNLVGKPVYVMGISAGAAFAVKIPKFFLDLIKNEGWSEDIKIDGVISGGWEWSGRCRGCSKGQAHVCLSVVGARWGQPTCGPPAPAGGRSCPRVSPRPRAAEVNAISWDSWRLMDANGNFKYPNFPPVAYISMVVRCRGAGRGQGWGNGLPAD